MLCRTPRLLQRSRSVLSLGVWLVTSLACLFTGALNAATSFPSAVLTIQTQPYQDWFEMEARIEPVDQGSVAAQTAGRVSQITVDVNDVVPADQLLIEITNTSQSAGLDQARAALQAAESQQGC